MGLFIATMLGKVTRPRTEEPKPECTSLTSNFVR